VLGEGDVLMVTRLDRLARSTRDLLNVLHEVAQSGAAFKSLHDHVPRTERHILEGTSYYNTGDVLSDTSRRKRRRPSRKIRLRCATQRASST
jgi:DNA invertase Pin-like site-specific DNA recombinase